VDLSAVDVVLVRPARAANVAAACRALKNMGLRSLVLVEPPGGLEAPDVRALAYGAWDVLDGARAVATLAEAVRDCTVVAGTSSREGPEQVSPRALAEEMAGRAGAGRVAVVFGPERTGLTREELQRCHLHVRIPSDAAQPSLNLAQAVLLVAYELRLSALRGQPEAGPAGETAASAALEGALAHVREALLAIGYLNPQNPDEAMAELRRFLARARVTPRELTLLRGVARQALWAAGSGPGPPGAPP
jgi:TrmH family RNA methyltransferase